jgi:hypothetical protein
MLFENAHLEDQERDTRITLRQVLRIDEATEVIVWASNTNIRENVFSDTTAVVQQRNEHTTRRS